MGNPMDFRRHHLGGFPLPGLAQEVGHEDSAGRPFRELSESGLLWLINATVFHPRGFALALSMDTTTGQVTGWDILGNGQEPWRYDEDLDQRFASAETTLAAYRKATASTPSDDLETFRLGEHPYVVIQCPGRVDGDTDMAVKAGGGIGDTDEVAVLLLLLIEHLTGVRADLYAHQIDVTRRAAGLPALRPEPSGVDSEDTNA